MLKDYIILIKVKRLQLREYFDCVTGKTLYYKLVWLKKH